jgi:hypothetical protein
VRSQGPAKISIPNAKKRKNLNQECIEIPEKKSLKVLDSKQSNSPNLTKPYFYQLMNT